MKEIYIINPVRTAIGSFGGTLAPISTVDLGQTVIKKALEDEKYRDAVDEVFMGNVLQAGNGQNPARQAALKAGIKTPVPATTINTVCGSGLHAVAMAYNTIRSGQIELAVAGGMESMSNAPYLLKKARDGYRLGNGEMIDELVFDGLTCPFNNYHMGITAENVAKKHSVSREEQDHYAAASQEKAGKARAEGKFKDEITPVTFKKRKEEIVFQEDEYIREGSTFEKLSKLRPAFDKTGSVTAGNASGINDGAAAMIVASKEKCDELGAKPMAKILGYTTIGLEPEIMGMGPVDAIKKLMKTTNFNLDQVDLFELNEAFASQSIAVRKELNIPEEKVNIYGGAIALGHPIGASGARILVTLLHALKREGKRYGVASLCVGTGMGLAMLVENVEA